MEAATYGIAQKNSDGTFELLWINEQTIFEACEENGMLTVT